MKQLLVFQFDLCKMSSCTTKDVLVYPRLKSTGLEYIGKVLTSIRIILVVTLIYYFIFYSVVECFPSRGAIDIFNPNTKDSRESKKSFTYDAVYDWK